MGSPFLLLEPADPSIFIITLASSRLNGSGRGLFTGVRGRLILRGSLASPRSGTIWGMQQRRLGYPAGGNPGPRSLEVESMTSLRVPGALSGPLAGTRFIDGVAGAVALSESPYPRPGAQPADVRRYFRGSPGAARVSVVGQLVSAASLAWFTASVAKLAGRSGRGSRGLRAAAVSGGGLAATSLATSALCAAALTGSRGEQDASAALHRLMF